VDGLLLLFENLKFEFIIFISRVIIVGDFNVSHKPIDTCDPGEDLNVNKN
jgi:exonuclease III